MSTLINLTVTTSTFKGPHNLSGPQQESYRDGVKESIQEADPGAIFGVTGRPDSFRVITTLTADEVDKMDSVFTVTQL